MRLRHQPPPSPFELRQIRAAEPMWPVWVALTGLTLSTGGLVAVLVGFTGRSLHSNGWFWLALLTGTIAGLTALAFQTRSRVTRRMQTALILSLIVHVILTFVFKESILAIIAEPNDSKGASVQPMPTIPEYYMPSPTGATAQQAFERPVETTRAETSTEVAVRSSQTSEFTPSHRPTLQSQSETAEALQPTPMELQRQAQAAPRRAEQMSRLSRQDLQQARIAAPRKVTAPRQRLRPQRQRPSQQQLEAPQEESERMAENSPRMNAPQMRRNADASQQTAMANTAERQMERARTEDAPRLRAPRANRPNRSRAESSRIAETQAESLAPAQRSQPRSQPNRSQSANNAQNSAQPEAEAAQRLSRSSNRPTRAARASRQASTRSEASDQVAALSRSRTSRRSNSDLRPSLSAPRSASATPRRSAATARSASASAANIASPSSASAASSQASSSASAMSAPSDAAERMSGNSGGRPSRGRPSPTGSGSATGQTAAVQGYTGSRRNNANLRAGSSTATGNAASMARSSSGSSRATASGSAQQIATSGTPGSGSSATASTDQLANAAGATGQLTRQSRGRTGRTNRPSSSGDTSNADAVAAASSGSTGSVSRRTDGSSPQVGDVATADSNAISRRSASTGRINGSDANAQAIDGPESPSTSRGDTGQTAEQFAASVDGDATRRSTNSGPRGQRTSRNSNSPSGDPNSSVAAATSSGAQPQRASTGDAIGPDPDNMATASRGIPSRQSPRRARMRPGRTSASDVDSPSTQTGESSEDSASETLAADTLEPNSGIDRVASRVRVRNNATPGRGGLATEVASSAGIPTRRASRQSQLVHNAPQRFLRKSSGGRASVSGQAAEVNPAFARRTRRRTNPNAQGAIGQPSAAVEASIELGLAYVASVQQPDGRWTLQNTAPEGADNPDTQASLKADSAATGLALLSFLGAGYDHLEDNYAENIRGGLEFLIANQQSNGDLYVKNPNHSTNDGLWYYSHGIAAIALCEAYGMTGDPRLKEPAQKAINFIVKSQHPDRGGWRYDPRKMSDLSVSGWQLMALRSAQLAGLTVPESAIKGTQQLLDRSQAAPDDGSRYCYNPWGNDTEKGRFGPRPNTTMTAVGLMMRLYTGWKKDRPEMQRGRDHLLANLPNADAAPSFSALGNPNRDTYYWYSGTIVMYHLQGEHWTQWRDTLYPLLTQSQQRQGDLTGSWNPRQPVADRWSIHAGRLYLTTLNLLSLEVHHRHLPLFSDGLELAE